MQLSDRNFDSLVNRFEKKIYATAKGAWRLKLLQEDLHDIQQQSALQIWDAGCGFAQIAQWLAASGHNLTLCDISEKMLRRAQENFIKAGLQGQFFHQSAQSLAAELPPFDVILFHAVLEWLAQPVQVLRTISERVKPGGYLSLLFYNRNAMVYSNVLKGGWRLEHILTDNYLGRGSRLTPPNPQYPHEVMDQLQQNGFKVVIHTGIRVFHDYLSQTNLAQSSIEELFTLEYRFCRTPGYRDMGRYVHLLLQKPEN